MIALDRLDIWEKLSGPYNTSRDIPNLIKELSNSFSKEVFDEIVWEYIYHQNTVYESTFATIPYLLDIMDKSDSIDYKLESIICIGILLIDFNKDTDLDNEIFKYSILDEEAKNEIKKDYLLCLSDFNKKIEELLVHAKRLGKEDERYFLLSYLVSKNMHKEAKVFRDFSSNDEYVFLCPYCDEEIFLWNEENILNAYSKDPVMYENQKKLDIELVDNKDLDYLENIIDELDIKSLKPILKYFKGDIVCDKCNKKSNVFKGISHIYDK